jgi:hypothetical protein
MIKIIKIWLKEDLSVMVLYFGIVEKYAKSTDCCHIGHGYACSCLWEISSEQPRRLYEHMITTALLATCGYRRITSDTGGCTDDNVINILDYR